MKNIKQLFEQEKKVSLSDGEKLLMWQSIEKTIRKEPVVSPYSPVFGMFSFVAKVRVIAVALLILPVAVVAVSETTVPGNALYAVKVNVNEEVVRMLSMTATSKASWEIRRVERRLEEAQELTALNTIDEDTSAIIESGLAKNIEQATEDIEKVEEKDEVDAEDLSSDLSVTLEAHEVVLEETAETSQNDTSKKLAKKVQATTVELEEKQAQKKQEKDGERKVKGIQTEEEDVENVDEEETPLDEKQSKEIVAVRDDLQDLSSSLQQLQENTESTQSTEGDISFSEVVTDADKFITDANNLIANQKYDQALEKLREARALVVRADKIREARERVRKIKEKNNTENIETEDVAVEQKDETQIDGKDGTEEVIEEVQVEDISEGEQETEEADQVVPVETTELTNSEGEIL